MTRLTDSSPLITLLFLLFSVFPASGQVPGTPCTVTGPALTDARRGDLGTAPAGPFTEIACLEIRNDRAFEREDEVAFSSIPVPASIGLSDLSNLAVIGPGERRVAAQFQATSRWGGTQDDGARAVRWLGIALQARVPADSTVTYSLRNYDTLPAAGDTFAASITPSGADFVIDTGVATFTLDPANPSLFETISIDTDDDGTGRTQIYSDTAGAGPRLDVGGLVLDTSNPGRVTVDQVDSEDDFRILEAGPARVVVAARGHFSDPGGSTLCTSETPSYERFGYTVVATFTRGSRDIDLRFHVRNECSDAFNAPWDDDGIVIERASWELPFQLTPDNAYSAGLGATVVVSPADFAGTTVVEQRKGAGAPWARRARVSRDATPLATGEILDRPIVAVAGTGIVVSLQMPWMQYREPQALAVEGSALSLRTISEPQMVGEAKGVWGQAIVRPTSTTLALGGGATHEAWVEAQRDAGLALLERGLLVRLPLAQVNASGMFPSLGTAAASSVKTEYETMIARLHDETVSPGGQWDLAKTFGSQLWPEVASRDPFAVENDTPADHPSEYNYWNPTTAEFLEFLRTGDPRWVWDFALPQSRLQAFTAYINIGEHDHGNRNGFAAASGNPGTDGHWHRPNCQGTGTCGSADYTYNTGLHLAQALRPDPVLQDRFAQMGATAINRYALPQAQQDEREQFVDEVDIQRFHMQNFEGLANCAEMVSGARGLACHDKLMELAAELVDDNLSAGAMCQADIPSPTTCAQPQQFMKNSMFYPFFMRLFRNYGDLGGGLRRALVEGPESFYTWGAPRLANGVDLNTEGDWAPVLQCTKNAGADDLTGCVPEWVDGSPMFFPNRPQTMGLLLMAHELDPTVDLCDVAKNALVAFGGLIEIWDEYARAGNGWIKGPAQMMQSMAFAVGLVDTCDGADPGNFPPTVTITTPAGGSSFPDGATVSFAGTAQDPEDGALGPQIAWSSNLDGALGTGATLDVVLSVGNHTITASVDDSGGASGLDTVAITVTGGGGGGGCENGNLLAQDFEGGLGDWTASGLWHATTSSACAPAGPTTPAGAAYFGQDGTCDYDTGVQVSGDLVSPAIAGIDATSELDFAFFREVESTPGEAWDHTEVAISVEGSGTWTVVWQRDADDPSAGAWTASGKLSLAAWDGQTIRVRFRFDSGDEEANDFVGWLIDDVRVTGTCEVTGLFLDGFESGDLSAWSMAG